MVVDEFQDTSPIQLALFVRLAEFVKATHWVGDTKQAIYGFRGADPALMQAAGKRFQHDKALTESRRHRPELVDFFNGHFPEIFEKTHEMVPAEVRFAAYRKKQKFLPPAVEIWLLSSGRLKKDGSPTAVKVDEANRCVVRGILEIKNSEMLISDRRNENHDTESPLPIRWKDIAVLCRSNNTASSIAAMLNAAGVPAARQTAGLLSTPECVFALACLRWLNDESDSLSVAEILSLEKCCEIEEWLQDRLDWVQAKTGGSWGLDAGKMRSTTLQRIAPLREKTRMLTPSELLDAVLVHGDISGIASQWGCDRADTRRANLEALRGLVATYESECLSSGNAASHAGFLIWCGSLASNAQDMCAFDESTDAVQVMTWHGSKGLEWPVVICLDLDKEPRPRIWNSPTVTSNLPFDPDHPLSGRTIQFWPYPFGKQTSEVPLQDRVANSKFGQAAAAEAGREQCRLHYVVMTRARDVLVFPQTTDSAPWLPEGILREVFRMPTGESDEDNIGALRRKIRRLQPYEPGPIVPKNDPIQWFVPPKPPIPIPPADLIPSSLPAAQNSQSAEVVSYGPALPIPAGTNQQDLGNAFHGILSGSLSRPGEDFTRQTDAILTSHNLKVKADEVTKSVQAFHTSIVSRFKPKQILVEVPFAYWNPEGQRIAGNMDLVLITDDGVVLIDHKAYLGKNFADHAVTYSGQIAAYGDALKSQGFRMSSAWINFYTQGKMVRLAFAENSPKPPDIMAGQPH